uniref:Uncharacterized protein n=1 Tax=Cucumis melo TaxID=3656 RepID=A0A9I9E0B9_CUCME
MAENKTVEQSEKKGTPTTTNPSGRDTKIVCFDGLVLEQAQLRATSHNDA